MERIIIRKYKRINKSRRIRSHTLCDEYLSWNFCLFLGRIEIFYYKIISLVFIYHEALNIRSLKRCLCVTLLCERRKKTWEKIIFVLM